MKRVLCALVMSLSLLGITAAAANEFADLKPASVNDLTAKLSTDDSVYLTWGKALYADSYIIQKSKTADGEFKVEATSVKALSYTDKDSEGCIFYRVIPVNKNGQGTPVYTKARPDLAESLKMAAPENRTVSGAVTVGDYVYTAEKGDYTLGVYRIGADEITPVTAQRYEAFDGMAIAQKGEYVFVSGKPVRGNSVMMVWSIADREAPKLVHSILCPTYIGLKLYGDFLLSYGGDDEGVSVINVKQPRKAYIYTTLLDVGVVNSVYLDGNKLYIGAQDGMFYCANVLDFKYPLKYSTLNYAFTTRIMQESMLEEENWTGGTYFWDRTYTYAPLMRGMYAHNGYAYIATEYGIKTADAQNYRKLKYITPVDNMLTLDKNAFLMADGNLLYSANSDVLAVYNITNPKEAKLVEKHLPTLQSNIVAICKTDRGKLVVTENGSITLYK